MDNKFVLKSQTIWGVLFGFVGLALSVFGYQFSSGAEAEITDAVGKTIAAAGGLWALVGRYRVGDLFFKKPSA